MSRKVVLHRAMKFGGYFAQENDTLNFLSNLKSRRGLWAFRIYEKADPISSEQI